MDQRLTRLIDAYRGMGPVAVAYSGGVDSTLALWAAAEALGDGAVGVFVRSEFISRAERERAMRMAAHLGLAFGAEDGRGVLEREVSALAEAGLRANGPDRCYRCKLKVLEALRRAAPGRALAEGTNADDDPARPGRRAVAEFGARSPLAECGIGKAGVRELARMLGLPNADDPSNSCLATRVPEGHELTFARLAAVEGLERAAREMGLADLRARLVPGVLGAADGVRLLVRPAQALLAQSSLDALRERALFLGFSEFSLGERA